MSDSIKPEQDDQQASAYDEALDSALKMVFRSSQLGEQGKDESSTLVGRYKLLEQIGEGGFGVVYMAEQQEPIRRRVALKIIKLGMDTKQVVARFEAERQALAMMDHPNIARVLDAGATESGRPFFVMELVRGVPITNYCDKNQVGVRQRLELFVSVCNAVQHAHQKGIIHRDLKPGNVMVTLHDGTPVPKVIDFGIARATQARLTERTLFTSFGQFVGTPAYISPEQAEMSGLDVDTRSDIYSLGVLLYELLTGSTPLDDKKLRSLGYAQMLEVIRDEEPATPSTRLSESGEAAATISASRGTNPTKLFQQLRGELDWIVMKSLEKDRTRRYESATGLAADVLRHLNDEPVLARPPSTGYKLRKFSRKYKRPLAAIVALASILILATVVSIWQAVFALSAQDRAEAERLQAKIAKGAAEVARNNAVEAMRREADLRLVADQQRQDARRQLYYTEMNLIGRLLITPHRAHLRSDPLLDNWRFAIHGEDMRGWEWYFYRSLARTDTLSLRGHRGPVRSVSWSHDGKTLASTGEDGSVRLWDVASPQEPRIIAAHDAQAYAVSFNPDGTQLASSAADRSIKIWNAATGELEFTLTNESGHTQALAWSPNGSMLAAGNTDGRLRIWDVTSREAIQDITGFVPKVFGTSLAWSPDSSHVAAPGDRTVKCWNVASGMLTHEFRGHTEAVFSVAWSPDGMTVASGAGDDTLKLWDAKTAQPVATLRGHTHTVQTISWSPDSKFLASGSWDDTICIWNAALHVRTATLHGHRGHVLQVAWSPDGSMLASSGREDELVKVWQPAKLQGFWGHRGTVRSISWDADGTRLASGADDGRIHIWDPTTGDTIHAWDAHAGGVNRLSWNRDGKLASAGVDKLIKIWDPTRGECVMELAGHTERVASVSWTADGRQIVSAASDRTIKIWDAGSGQLLHTLPGHSGAWPIVACSPVGDYVASGGGESTIRIWLAATGELVRELPVDGTVFGLTWSPDGQQLASAGASSTAKVWDVHDGRLLMEGPTTGWTHAIAWSPDGTRLAAGGSSKDVQLWDTRTGFQAASLHGHTSDIWSISWSPYGMRLATSGQDGTVRIWDATAAFQQQRSAKLLPVLNRKIDAGVDAFNDWHLRAAVHARSGQWEKSAADYELLRRRWPAKAPLLLQSNWWVVGPYPDKLVDHFPPETNANPTSLLVSKDDDAATQTSLTWQPLSYVDHDVLPLQDIFGLEQPFSAYALTRVYSPQPRHVGLLVDCDDPCRIWNNGQLIYEVARLPTADRDQDIIPVSLISGWNTLLVKVVHQCQQPGIYVRLVDDAVELAELYEQRGAWANAAKVYSNVLDEQPDALEFLTRRAAAHQRLGEWRLAILDFSTALELEPNDVSLCATLSWLLATCPDAELRDPARALALAEEVARQHPHAADSWKLLGVAHFSSENWEAAIAALDQFQQSAGDADGCYVLAMAHWRLGDTDAAATWYHSAISQHDKRTGDQQLAREAHDLLMAVDISPHGGDFRQPQRVQFQAAGKPAPLYYTLDGSTPTAQSLEYHEPLLIDDAVTVRVRAIDASGKAGPVTTAEFMVDANIVSLQDAAWTVHDATGPQVRQGPSQWVVHDGVVTQLSNIFTYELAEESPFLERSMRRDGTLRIYKDTADFTDGELALEIRSHDDDGIGVAFRVADADHYYLFAMDSQRKFRILARKNGADYELLDANDRGYEPGQWQHIRVVQDGPRLSVFVDDEKDLEAEDSTFKQGTIALYSWGSTGVSFRRITLKAAGNESP